MPQAKPQITSDPTGRGAKRRAETRARLLDAALQVMAEKGAGAATIQEITDAADVGFGSFYNHFKSKEEIFQAVVDHLVEGLGNALDRLAEKSDDPAEVMAVSIRHVIRHAADHPTWSKFLLRNALSMEPLQMGLARRMARDAMIGIRQKRFAADDPDGGVNAVAGIVLTFIAAVTQKRANRHAPERAATLALTVLGVPREEAAEIARRPLPPLDWDREV